jgi:hypothetical protein
MKIYYRTLLIALAFSFAIGILSHGAMFLTRLYPYPNDYQAIATNSLFLSIIGMIISPVLLFVTFYFIGKKPETIGEFYSHLLSFFVGNLIGFAVGNFLGTFLTVVEMPFEYVVYMLLFSFVGSPFSSSFFVGFSALAIGYIIRKSKKPNDAQA